MKSDKSEPHILKGGISVDQRGSVRFVNDFSFEGIKRFYQVENLNTNIIRAFHGHLKEAKYVYVSKGTVLVCAVYLDNIKKPSKKQKVHKFVLSSQLPQVLFIPPQFANGFKSLEEGSQILFFSTSTLEDSLQDDYRFPYNYWGEDVWKDEHI